MSINAAVVIFGLLCLGVLFLDLGTTNKEREDRALRWIGALGPIIAAGALLIAVQQFQLSRITAERQDRAYLFLSRSGIEIAPNKSPYVSLALKNEGKTASLDSTFSTSCKMYDWPVNFGPYHGAPGSSPLRSVLAPSEETTIYFDCGPPLSEQDITDLKAGKKVIILIGDAKYRDVFDVQRRYVYRRMVGGIAGLNGNLFAHTPISDEVD